MLHEPRYLENVDAKNFDQRLKRLARDKGYTLSVIQQDDLRWYDIKRDEIDIAQLETLPTNDGLELRSARLALEENGDFFDALNAELWNAYIIPETIGQVREYTEYLIRRTVDRMKHDSPEDEAKWQANHAILARGLPPIAPTASTQERVPT
jgi:hypothetical protein